MVKTCTKAAGIVKKIHGENNVLKFTKQLNLKEKTLQKAYSCLEKAAESKKLLRGIKQVAKAIRTKKKGLVIMAGNVTPADVVLHLPIMCVNNEVPFFFVDNRKELGEASKIKRNTCCVMLRDDILLEDKKYQKKLQAVIAKCTKSVQKFKEALNKNAL